MAQRLHYIDALKGFTIFLVVFAHTIAWSYGQGTQFTAADGYALQHAGTTWLFALVYSFHMPLFFFISGFLAYGSLLRHGATKVARMRTLQLLVPYIAATAVVVVLLQQEMNYWFLVALWLMYMVTALSRLSRWLNPWLLWVAIYAAATIWKPLNDIPYLFLSSFKLFFPIFLCGYYFAAFPRGVQKARRWVYPLSLTLFVALFVLPMVIPAMGQFYIFTGGAGAMVYTWVRSLCAILFLWFFFEKHCQELPYRGWLETAGVSSMVIYIVHVLFKFAVPPLGDLMASQVAYPVLVQIIYAGVLSVVLVNLSVVVGKLLGDDRVLGRLFLGK